MIVLKVFPFLIVRLGTCLHAAGFTACGFVSIPHSQAGNSISSARIAVSCVFPFLIVRLGTGTGDYPCPFNWSFHSSQLGWERGCQCLSLESSNVSIPHSQAGNGGGEMARKKQDKRFHSSQLGWEHSVFFVFPLQANQFPFLIVRLGTILVINGDLFEIYSFHSSQLGWELIIYYQISLHLSSFHSSQLGWEQVIIINNLKTNKKFPFLIVRLGTGIW